jgi:hypothetical protein
MEKSSPILSFPETRVLTDSDSLPVLRVDVELQVPQDRRDETVRLQRPAQSAGEDECSQQSPLAVSSILTLF